MKSILGFTVSKEAEAQTVIPEMAEAVKSNSCMVKIRFPGIHKELDYYNDKFPLKQGDIVFVSGKLAGQPGRITRVITKFCVHTKDYEKVLRVLDVSLHGDFRRVKAQMVSLGEIPLTPERFESWIIPPVDPKAVAEEDELICGEGFTLDIYDVDACDDLTWKIWDRGINYYFDGNLKYLCVKNGVGVAFVKGENWYRVEFRLHEDGWMTGIYCDCPYLGLCKHEAAVAMALLTLEKEAGYDFKTDFVALDQETFWQLVSMAEEIKI